MRPSSPHYDHRGNASCNKERSQKRAAYCSGRWKLGGQLDHGRTMATKHSRGRQGHALWRSVAGEWRTRRRLIRRSASRSQSQNGADGKERPFRDGVDTELLVLAITHRCTQFTRVSQSHASSLIIPPSSHWLSIPQACRHPHRLVVPPRLCLRVRATLSVRPSSRRRDRRRARMAQAATSGPSE